MNAGNENGTAGTADAVVTDTSPEDALAPRTAQRRIPLSRPSASSPKPSEQKVERSAHPGWETAAERVPTVGRRVYCTGGSGVILQVRGKTGDGSRLLELQLDDGRRASFFAAGSNVLLAPDDATS